MCLTVCFVVQISETNLGTGTENGCPSLRCRAFDLCVLPCPCSPPVPSNHQAVGARAACWPRPCWHPLNLGGGSHISTDHWEEQKLPCGHFTQINMQIRRQMRPRNVGHSEGRRAGAGTSSGEFGTGSKASSAFSRSWTCWVTPPPAEIS